MNAYFNELSFTPYSDREEVKKGLTAFIECLKSLDEFGIKNIKRSNQIDNKCLLGRETYLRMLNDKGIVDDDMKSVLINRWNRMMSLLTSILFFIWGMNLWSVKDWDGLPKNWRTRLH